MWEYMLYTKLSVQLTTSECCQGDIGQVARTENVVARGKDEREILSV
jgi:hypothetical protein